MQGFVYLSLKKDILELHCDSNGVIECVSQLTEVAVDCQIVQVNSSIRGILVVAT